MRREVAVIGGGVAGIQVSRELSELGYKVHLIEKSPSIGGRMAQLDKVFPTNDCAICILGPVMIGCAQEKNIHIMTWSEVKGVKKEGKFFKLKVKQYPRYVDEAKCNACEKCKEVCPVEIEDEFNEKINKRKAIYKHFPQAIPNSFLIDKKGTPLCKSSCPIGVNIQAILSLTLQKNYHKALSLLLNEMPLPGVMSRICPHLCEEGCARKEIDEAVNIRGVKRFITQKTYTPTKIEVTSPYSVGIIGSGPGGISVGYYLRKYGYQVTIFEKSHKIGGMLTKAIPEFRLPTSVVDKDLDYLKQMGIKFKTSHYVTSLSQLKEQFDAVVVAVGTGRGRRLNIKGEELRDVFFGVEFLEKIKEKEKIKIGKKVIVIGGGNTAIDVSRTVVRLGVNRVVLLYRRSEVEMPANKEEIESAKEEGVEIRVLTQPVEIVSKGGKVVGVRCVKMKLGEEDGSGRRKPIPLEGSEFFLPGDSVIVAIGEEVDLPLLKKLNLKTTNYGVWVDEHYHTSHQGVFAVGDVVNGGGTAVEAIGMGKEVARRVREYLEKKERKGGEKKKEVKEVKVEVKEKKKRLPIKMIPVEERVTTFHEVIKPYTEEELTQEIKRCLQCGGCCECGECVEVCEVKAIDHRMGEREVELKVEAVVIAIGGEGYDLMALKEYGYKDIDNVFSSLEFERLLSSSGPTGGELVLKNKQLPRKIAFIQCVGMRDKRYNDYCGAVCCMYTTKEAILAKEHIEGVEVFVFYLDLRSYGKGYYSYVENAKKRYKIKYIRSKPGKITKEGDEIVLHYEDTLTNEIKKLKVDMVVLSGGLRGSKDIYELGEKFGFEVEGNGFIKSKNLLPFEILQSPPLFFCGSSLYPQDISSSIVQAKAVAGRLMEVLGE